MNNSKFTSNIANRKVILMLFFTSFLYVFQLSKLPEKMTFSDMALRVLYGVNNCYSTSLVEVVKWSIPYIIIIYCVGRYIENTILIKNSPIWLIRSRAYSRWLSRMIMNIFFIIAAYLIAYFFFTCLLSRIFSGNFLGTSVFFREDNLYLSQESISPIFIVVQFMLSLTTLTLISLIQVIVTTLFNNSTSGMIVSIFMIIISGVLSKFNLVNPIMLSKHNIIDSRLEAYPNVTIIISIVLISTIYLVLLQNIRRMMRR